jgi:hypothetical protein
MKVIGLSGQAWAWAGVGAWPVKAETTARTESTAHRIIVGFTLLFSSGSI